MRFATESLTPALWAEVTPLLQRHYREIASFQDIPLAPDVDTYMATAATGVIRVYTARTHDEGMLVGYALWFIRLNPHYSTSLQAVSDVVFLDAPLRGFAGAKFLAYMERQLDAEGVEVRYHHIKEKHNWSAMLGRMGYEPHDVIWAKRTHP